MNLNNQFTLENKVAVVTGAANGIGLAIAQTLQAAGAKVVYSDISDPGLDLQDDQASFKLCDVSQVEQVVALVNYAVEKFGSLDIMVNNAGIGALGGALDTKDEDWKKVIDVNLSGTFYGTREAAKIMKAKSIKGSIINLSSILGTVGMQSTIAYCASKGGVVQLTRAAALDLASLEIRVNAIAPAFIATKMTEGVFADPNFNAMIMANTPLAKVGEPQDIANAALYLATPASKYVTGTILHVDGGWTAH